MAKASDALAVLVLKDTASTSRRAVYKRQLTHKFQTNDATWQATVTAIQSFDCTRNLAQEQCHWESAMLALAVVGILCVSVESELLGVEMAQFMEEKIEENPGGPNSLAYSPVFIALKGVLLGTSGLLFLALVMRYRIVWKIRVVTHQLPKAGTFLSAYSGLRSRFMLEALVCIFHMPLLSAERRIFRWGEYDVVCLDQLDVVVFTRIYLVGRVLRNQLGLSSISHDARLIGSIHKMDLSSIWFTIKFCFQKFPLESTWSILFIDWFLSSAALNFFERASNPTETSASDAIWLTIVTVTGVGYGDIFPRTLGGKIIIAIGGIIGGMIIACLLRVGLIDALQLSPQEQKVLDVAHFYRYIRQHIADRQVRSNNELTRTIKLFQSIAAPSAT
ncbi:hypothetical protein BBP00_00009490 [Phytophthora kernoviae]|uniref:Potassium channel domain-containing protein n=2 Tax=Phytophthora kernoviae TaxID=325452 RepID=A0A3F2RCF7_9STRA|nr:hypothetical protein BBP00_00009490 [Phytophthora kernoviae]